MLKFFLGLYSFTYSKFVKYSQTKLKRQIQHLVENVAWVFATKHTKRGNEKKRKNGKEEKSKSNIRIEGEGRREGDDWAGLKNASTCSSSLPQQSLEQFCDLRQVSESEFYNKRKGEGEAGNT